MTTEFVIDDRDFNTLSFDEKNDVYMRKFGKLYMPPTEEEKQAILKEFGLSD